MYPHQPFFTFEYLEARDAIRAGTYTPVFLKHLPRPYQDQDIAHSAIIRTSLERAGQAGTCPSSQADAAQTTLLHALDLMVRVMGPVYVRRLTDMSADVVALTAITLVFHSNLDFSQIPDQRTHDLREALYGIYLGYFSCQLTPAFPSSTLGGLMEALPAPYSAHQHAIHFTQNHTGAVILH